MAQQTKQMDLKGKVSVVTGGTSGIGLAIATALAEAGSDIVVRRRFYTYCAFPQRPGPRKWCWSAKERISSCRLDISFP